MIRVLLVDDDDLVDHCAAEGIAYTSFFPLGGFSPLQSDTLASVATRVGATPQQTALAWLLQRSPTMLLIPGTSSREHLRENLAAADLVLPPEAVADHVLRALGRTRGGDDDVALLVFAHAAATTAARLGSGP